MITKMCMEQTRALRAPTELPIMGSITVLTVLAEATGNRAAAGLPVSDLQNVRPA